MTVIKSVVFRIRRKIVKRRVRLSVSSVNHRLRTVIYYRFGIIFIYSDKFAYLNTKRFSPYILFGIGVTVAPGNETFASLNIPLGIGAKYKVANRLNLGLEFSFRKLFGDSFDVTDGNNAFLDNPYGISGSAFKNKDWYSLLMFSVTWDFGLRCRTCNNRYSSGSF